MSYTIKYEDFLKTISEGDTFFITTPFNLFKPHTYLSCIIRLIAGTPNHCAVYFDELLYGAKQQGVVKLPFYDEIKGQRVTVKRKINDDIVEKKQWCEERLNKKYDGISLFLYEPLLYATGKWYGKTGVLAENRFFCYEYAGGANKYDKCDRMIGKEFFGWIMLETIIEDVIVTK